LSEDFQTVSINEFSPKNGKMAIPGCNVFKDRLTRWWDPDERSLLLKEKNTKFETEDDYYEYEE
jgi:hypothetical protein